jgi:hypothetical protein
MRACAPAYGLTIALGYFILQSVTISAIAYEATLWRALFAVIDDLQQH